MKDLFILVADQEELRLTEYFQNFTSLRFRITQHKGNCSTEWISVQKTVNN